MTQKNKILLLTDVFPCSNYSGGIMNQQLCYFLLEEKFSIHCALLQQSEVSEKKDDITIQKIPTIIFQKPTENNNTSKYSNQIDKINHDIVSYIKKNKINTIWCPIQGESLLRILDYIQENTKGITIVPQIWDPPEWILHVLKYNENDKKNILNLFDKVIAKSSYVLTASQPMNEIYAKKYKIKCSPIYCSYNFEIPETIPKKHSKDFTIIFSGQTYATQAICALLKALDKINWQYNNKNIILKYFGNNQDDFFKKNPHVKMCGHLSQEDLIEEEKKVDLLYCPYRFDDTKLKIVSQQSYPSKIVTYIPSSTPILIHAEKDSSIYKNFEKYECGFLLESLNEDVIIQTITDIIETSKKQQEQLIKNTYKLMQQVFSPETNKKTFMKALGIQYTPQKRYHILEINNVDLPGKRWNGYDLMEYLNQKPQYIVNQICTYKTSNNNDVVKIYNDSEQELEYRLLDFEAENLSVHSCLSASSPILTEKNVYKNADLLHLHLIHNMKLSLFSLIEICSKKPSIITIHDPWTFTGHCVYPQDCKLYQTGCKKCPDLNRLFPLKCDNCHELWQLKKKVYEHLDVDFVVTTPYMYNLFNESPLTKGKRVHLIPFGIDIDEFAGITQQQARQRYKIPDNHIVLFHRAQLASKGTPYLVNALKELNMSQKITLITCSETGHFKSLEKEINIIELGDIDSSELKYAYNACDIYVMPSIGESFGMMAVEAMSCSKPVIVFNNSALPSVTFAPECGIAVENLNSHKLMEAIKWLIENPKERERRGKLGRKIVEENYRIETYHQKIEDLYQEVMVRKHDNSHLNLVQQKPVENKNTLAIKNQLNQLTKKLFPPKSPQYEQLFYNLPKNSSTPTKKIAYSDFNVQLVLNQYNHDVVKNWRNFNNSSQVMGWQKLRRKTKTFLRLLLKDRRKMIEVILEKTIGKKNAK